MFQYDWDWNIIWQYRHAFLEGLTITAQLSCISIAAGTVIGLIMGILLSSQLTLFPLFRGALLLIVYSVKALPPLILLLLFYYWLPYALGVRSSFWLATIALTIGLSAFVADVFRHALSGVPRPLVQACHALGMSHWVTLQRFVVPEAFRSIIPTLGLLYLDIFKLSSLASIIAVPELVHRASEVSTYTYRFLEVYAALAVIYLSILLPFSYLVRRMETSSFFIRRS